MADINIDTFGITQPNTASNIANDTDSGQTNKDQILQQFSTDSTTKGTELHDLINSNGFFFRGDYDDFNHFYLFPRNDPYRMLGTTREYVFFTKPDLHIFESTTEYGKLNSEIANDPFFADLMDRGYGQSVLANLQYSLNTKNKSPFVNLLTNYKTSGLDLSAIAAGDIESATNAFGTRIFYRRPTDTSNEENEFTIEFKDNKYLDCYLWFKAYDVYEQRKYQGKVSPVSNSYIFNKVLSDQMTIFKFIVGDDGTTLIHWSCIWGCYPKSVPRDTFSDLPQDGQLKFSINWHGAFIDDMDPMIIMHFNKLSDLLTSKISGWSEDNYINLFDQNIQGITQKNMLVPRVIPDKLKTTNSPYTLYKLVWYTDE